ncbi:myelin protein zero-like protein 1 [Tachyglossus aculeatus]|uniref:myelin protein zero-like protein 1 n=1 Tax=Tachyglossus aculeatus TaxID=9261 RepID=UPI0018F69DB9|nr:myelin protein zero-like protein 1 [Tachyglossus aculeatus]
MAVSAAARRRWRWLRGVLAAALGLGTARVSALEVFTPAEAFAANGTQVKLECTFKSENVVTSSTSFSWSFLAEGQPYPVSFFHYSQEKVYLGDYPLFAGRVTWAGNINKNDLSISIDNVQFKHNGTYICDAKNPPDIVSQPGHIRLLVVKKENLPEKQKNFPIWEVVGIVTAVVLGFTLLIVIILAVCSRKRNNKRDYTGCSTSESLMSPVKQAPRKSPSDTEGLVNSLPAGSHQGPVIYAQLDHSGGQHSNKINKSESVVYADIRKN